MGASIWEYACWAETSKNWGMSRVNMFTKFTKLAGKIISKSGVVNPWHIGTDPVPYHWLTDPHRILLFSSETFKIPTNYFWLIKSYKEITKSRNQGFYYSFCLMIVGYRSGRSKTFWILRIRIHNPVQTEWIHQIIYWWNIPRHFERKQVPHSKVEIGSRKVRIFRTK
jgi:hypothetical protein